MIGLSIDEERVACPVVCRMAHRPPPRRPRACGHTAFTSSPRSMIRYKVACIYTTHDYVCILHTHSACSSHMSRPLRTAPQTNPVSASQNRKLDRRHERTHSRQTRIPYTSRDPRATQPMGRPDHTPPFHMLQCARELSRRLEAGRREAQAAGEARTTHVIS